MLFEAGATIRGQKPPCPISALQPAVRFMDIAEKAGLTMKDVFGGVTTKKYIIETTGTGVAIFDYDNDGWPDIFIVNGTTLEGSPQGRSQPAISIHNNHDGTFTDVTVRRPGSATPAGDRVLASEITTTTVGKISMSPTTEKTGCTTTSMACSRKWEIGRCGRLGQRLGHGCAFVDYDRDGKLDLMVANYVNFDLATAPTPGEGASCIWKGVPVMCGPRGLPARHRTFCTTTGATENLKTFR